jgi:sugar phosphate isomerase/epimerase
MASLPVLVATGMVPSSLKAAMQQQVARTGGPKLKIGLNAYSFNTPLLNGEMSLDQLLEFCAQQNLEAVDLTGYYFKGYPRTPSDDVVYHVKRRAFLLGLDISGTGVRNDFTYSDEKKRKEDVQLVKNWIDIAAKLGAPVIRVFAGKQNVDAFTWDQVAEWMVRDIKECVEYGSQRGVMIGIQNHNDFIKTSEDALRILKMVDSPWCGLILDTGSFRGPDPYAEIAKAAPFAINWQIKENVFIGTEQVRVDLMRLVRAIMECGYRGYLPIETLGAGDPKVKVPAFLREVRSALTH